LVILSFLLAGVELRFFNCINFGFPYVGKTFEKTLKGEKKTKTFKG